MVIDMLATKYPELYHMADKRNWENIRKHGLLSTTALLDLFECEGDKRSEIESQLRFRTLRITHRDHGEAFIRDQDPMRDRPDKGIYLKDCLVGTTPQEWFEFLNRKTFFWTDTIGLNFMLGAILYRNRNHYIITVDTRKLLDSHADKVTLSSFNSGSLHNKRKRSRETFTPISHHSVPWVTELAVEYSVPNIADLMLSVDERISQWDNEKKERVIKVTRSIWPN